MFYGGSTAPRQVIGVRTISIPRGAVSYYEAQVRPLPARLQIRQSAYL